MKKIKFTMLALLTAGTMGAYAQKGVKFDPNYKGYYMLKTQFRGDGEALESNGAESKTMNGAAFMSTQEGSPTGQQWQFIPAGDGWYRMQTRLHGNKKCLEGDHRDSSPKKGVAYMENCNNVTGQFWKLEDAGNGYYRLKTKFQGNERSLEGNQVGGSKGGNAFMDKTQNAGGQLWYLVPVQ